MISDKKIGILYVDDESVALKYFAELFEGIAPVFTAISGEEGLRVFEANQHQIGVVLSDKNMPKMTGLEFLAKVRSINEEPLRILVTAYKDLNQAVDALNDGLLQSYLTKPYEPKDMMSKMRKSLDLFWIRQEKARILKDRAASFQEMIVSEKVNSLETLSIGLDHHVRKSLEVIRAYFDMLPSQLDQELEGSMPKDRFYWNDYYTNIGQQLDRVESIFIGLSECLAPEQSGDKNSTLDIIPGINLAELISEVGAAQTSQNSSIGFKVRGEKEFVIEGDQAKLLRLFSNLFRESIQNIGENNSGEIDIVIEKELFSDNTAGVSIYFSDNGEPIAATEKSRLFDPLFLRSDRPTDPGLGLGLLSCFIIAYQHGGMIQATAGSRKNSIHLLLPAAPRKLDSPRDNLVL